MNQKICRILNISVITVLVLTLYNIFVALKLTHTFDCPKSTTTPSRRLVRQVTPVVIKSIPVVRENISILNINLGRWDNSLEYRYFDNVFVGTRFIELSKLHKTCLATQSSLDKIYSIIQVAHHWDGPISLAVFGSGDEEFNNLFLYVTYLRECFPKLKNKVNFHFAFPRKNAPSKLTFNATSLNHLECDNPHGYLLHLTKSKQRKRFMRWKNQDVYPQNHLRNLARKNCQGEYVFLTDIDVIPSYGMVDLLDDFLVKDNCGKKLCAFVIPTFELDDRVRFPPNKSELLRLVDKGLSRPFHQKVFIYNQFATNFSRWQSSREDGPHVHISHPVTNFEFLYEPFYVAKDTVPAHDERFLGYGYTRNTQVYEMFLAGYEFLVLSPIFTIHWGLQLKKTRPPWRESQNTKNMKKFKEFKRELLVKYKTNSSKKQPNVDVGFVLGRG
ncbi:hypothetical protein WA026_006009 [Henosepilachna vigintioctopunctata]|uniref:Beta-1,4-glucuronyltransferase 1 n=1 Tax=Henosepilachna vigintioctopunctata TaxID=420089 RepID=A0AAW1U4P8_9CUCU